MLLLENGYGIEDYGSVILSIEFSQGGSGGDAGNKRIVL